MKYYYLDTFFRIDYFFKEIEILCNIMNNFTVSLLIDLMYPYFKWEVIRFRFAFRIYVFLHEHWHY